MARPFAASSALVVVLLAAPVAAQLVVDDAHRASAITHYRAGQELLLNEQFEKAEREFSLAIDDDPLLALAHYGLGQSRMALRKYPGAVEAFTGCRESYRHIFMLRQSDAATLDRRAQQEIIELQEAIRFYQSGRARSFGGVATTADTKVAQLEGRIRELQRLRQGGQGTFHVPAEVSLALGSAHFRNRELEAAEREWKAAVVENSKMGEAHNNLAALYAMAGRKQAGLDALQHAERAGFRVNPQLKADLNRLPDDGQAGRQR